MVRRILLTSCVLVLLGGLAGAGVWRWRTDRTFTIDQAVAAVRVGEPDQNQPEYSRTRSSAALYGLPRMDQGSCSILITPTDFDGLNELGVANKVWASDATDAAGLQQVAPFDTWRQAEAAFAALGARLDTCDGQEFGLGDMDTQRVRVEKLPAGPAGFWGPATRTWTLTSSEREDPFVLLFSARRLGNALLIDQSFPAASATGDSPGPVPDPGLGWRRLDELHQALSDQ